MPPFRAEGSSDVVKTSMKVTDQQFEPVRRNRRNSSTEEDQEKHHCRAERHRIVLPYPIFPRCPFQEDRRQRLFAARQHLFRTGFAAHVWVERRKVELAAWELQDPASYGHQGKNDSDRSPVRKTMRPLQIPVASSGRSPP